MGWFLRRGKNGGRKKRSKARDAAVRPHWDPQRTLAAVKVLTGLGVVVGLGLAWHFGHGWLREYARATHSEPVAAADVIIQDPPAWMSEGVKQELRRLVAAEAGADPVENTALRAAADALRRSAWVAEGNVRQVRRLVDGRVAVEADYRTPTAVIQARNGYYLVSDRGIRLPMLYDAEDLRFLELPVIERVRSAPPTAGEVWPGADVQAGLAMVRLLADESFFDQVRAIDVGQRDRRGRVRLALLTDEGEVQWGLPPGEAEGIEPTADQKLQSLRRVAERYNGRIDAGGRVVDLYVYGARVHEQGMQLNDSGWRSEFSYGR
ncbi:MAG: cell division protein FtsQ/DivIB [Phycisphaeraceae bacterium]